MFVHQLQKQQMKYPLIKPSFYFGLLKDLLFFIKHPIAEPHFDKSFRVKVYETIGLYVLKLVFLIPVIAFFALVYDPKNVQSVSMSERFAPMVLLLVGGVVLPFFEEAAFRLSLKFNPIYLTLSLSIFTYYFLTKAIFQTKISMVDDSFLLRILISGCIGALLLPIFHMDRIRRALALFWSKHFRSIYYLSCMIFAWMHITKYEITLLNVLLLPILTLPQLFSAIIYGYTRVSFGFIYPLMMHMSINMVALGLSFLPGD